MDEQKMWFLEMEFTLGEGTMKILKGSLGPN